MKKLTLILFVFTLLVSSKIIVAQNKLFTHQDSLRGSVTRERAWWDLTFYQLDVKINPSDSTFIGANTIRYKVLTSLQVMQIDLQQPMQIIKVVQDGKSLDFKRDGSAWFIELTKKQIAGDFNEITIDFSGKPKKESF